MPPLPRASEARRLAATRMSMAGKVSLPAGWAKRPARDHRAAWTRAGGPHDKWLLRTTGCKTLSKSGGLATVADAKTSTDDRSERSLDCVWYLQVVMAEGEGFEPSIELPLYTRSRRAPSTTRPPLLGAGHAARHSSSRRREKNQAVNHDFPKLPFRWRKSCFRGRFFPHGDALVSDQ